MNRLFILGIFLLALWGCSATKNETSSTNNRILIDSSDYEIVILDPDFDRWYQLAYNTGMDRSEAY